MKFSQRTKLIFLLLTPVVIVVAFYSIALTLDNLKPFSKESLIIGSFPLIYLFFFLTLFIFLSDRVFRVIFVVIGGASSLLLTSGNLTKHLLVSKTPLSALVFYFVLTFVLGFVLYIINLNNTGRKKNT